MTGSLGPVWIGAVVAALISALVTAFGWYVAHAREAARDAALRRDRIVDIQKALRAEIATYVAQLAEAQLADHLAGMERAMKADPAFVPFVPRESHDALYRALIEDIHLLPTEAVDPVVRYYTQLGAISALADDLRGPTYPTLAPERRLMIYRHFIEMKVQALVYAREARAALRDGIVAAAADPWLSSRAADRAGPAPAGSTSSSPSPPPVS